jgi:hypothetical protein
MIANARRDRKTLTPKQHKALVALLTPHDEAAEEAGVNASTLYRWLRQEPFLDAYRQARWRALEDAIGRLQAVAMKAANTLAENLEAITSGRCRRVSRSWKWP